MYTGTITELGIILADLVEDHADWSQETFGKDNVRGPSGPLEHLEKERKEALVAWLDVRLEDAKNSERMKKFREELADCLLLILDASRRGGCKIMQLLEAAREKMKVNKGRVWFKVDDMNSAVEHIKDL
jgi:hypothetical protein